jgi:hypothetical protein
MEKPINTGSRGKVACLLLEVEANIHGQNTQELLLTSSMLVSQNWENRE